MFVVKVEVIAFSYSSAKKQTNTENAFEKIVLVVACVALQVFLGFIFTTPGDCWV